MTYFWSPFWALKSRPFLTPKAVPNQRENYHLKSVGLCEVCIFGNKQCGGCVGPMLCKFEAILHPKLGHLGAMLGLSYIGAMRGLCWTKNGVHVALFLKSQMNARLLGPSPSWAIWGLCWPKLAMWWLCYSPSWAIWGLSSA